MHYRIRKAWDLPQRLHTPVEVFRSRRVHRREFLRLMGLGTLGAGIVLPTVGCSRPTDEEIEQAGASQSPETALAQIHGAQRNPKFEYGRPETARRAAAEYTNFYEFSAGKDSWSYVADFRPHPWTLEIGGLCSKPATLDIDDILKRFSLEERAYRHRCVETWAMCVPWTGFPLRELLKLVEPKPNAKFVEFATFNRPDEAPMMRRSSYPWPYSESLTIDEAMNELAFVATGIYGEPLPKQHGAPIRIVVPWKYGFKSIKSIDKITLVGSQPATFWNTLAPNEYDLEANVNPAVPHPRWSQRTEWMLGTNERYDTLLYNGYGDYVGSLYG